MGNDKMAKCKRCGKNGFFLRLNSNMICNNCEILQFRELEEARLKLLLNQLDSQLSDKQKLYDDIAEQAKSEALAKLQDNIDELNNTIFQNAAQIEVQNSNILNLEEKESALTKQVLSNSKKLSKIKEYYKSISNGIEKYYKKDVIFDDIFLPEVSNNIQDEINNLISPTIEIQLHCMNIKQLKNEFKNNKRIIDETLNRYKDRYTTKANVAIYRLMVIALSAELQNILYSINYGKLDIAVDAVKKTTEKYLKIATDGNQNIAPTLIKFIAEIEGLFINAVTIEYEYFVQKERIKEEQRALREQMRQEAEERKLLEQQKKQIEKEELKYTTEIDKVKELLALSDNETKTTQLQQRIDELSMMLENVQEQKEKITSLQNGLAGTVYIISNLGSFGDRMFKIGMTRRIQPQDRVDELGDASVPFRFDVHAMIFTDNAVELESNLHKELNNSRVNKINNRKEFFYSSVDDLQELVQKLNPTAEFTTTMLAEQYRQSQSFEDYDFSDTIPIDNLVDDEDDNEND